MVLGAIAIAAGAGEAAMGLMMMGQRAALGSFLAFTRAQETTADIAGASYLSKAGISGKGSLEFFKKLQNQEYRLAVYSTDSYDRTHPLSSERIAMLEGLYKKDPAWNKPTDPALEMRFQRVKAKLLGFINPKQAISNILKATRPSRPIMPEPTPIISAPIRTKRSRRPKRCSKTAPHDPYFLELKGQILLEGGKPAEAIAPLREAVATVHNAPLIASMLGHALIATEKTGRITPRRRRS